MNRTRTTGRRWNMTIDNTDRPVAPESSYWKGG
jgi:hypothetical protein